MKRLLTKPYRNIDQLPLIARLGILCLALLFIYFIWYSGFWTNLYQTINTITTRINSLESSNAKLAEQLELLKKEVKAKEEWFTRNERIAATNFTELLSSHQTSKVLYDLLVSNSKLSLLQLKNIAPKAISLPQANINNAFEHGIIIKFSGDYFSTMQYLQALEKLKWKLFWDQLEYKVIQYPLAEITLQIHTISAESDWINV